ncbi:3-dehydroquinate synthase [Alienimonas californiensis]|uniref:3-dehydroquinate synthase n=1 Tax=Alienimonas californiensis TaxID=2527989 RepID=A0A517P9D6_9PLAN|nr:3-dehydroquinate synthase [Alienimonas californiensis]QDT15978.1 3-dehydroquinate synthase [Alienimonas californiensis]
MRVSPGGRPATGYDIVLQAGVLRETAAFLTDRLPDCRAAVVVTDGNLRDLAAPLTDALRGVGVASALHVVEPGEKSKSLESLHGIYGTLLDLKADRRACVIAVGGGVVGDLAGFAAASYMRGVSLIQVPTSLLAMVDSSVGGKTGVNLPRGKNLVGAFHQPAGVLVDPDVLRTLPDREYHGGLAEVVKYGVISDAAFFGWLEENAGAILDRDPAVLVPLIARCCELKAAVVAADEFETTGVRATLNYGHTFAHAFENLAGYGVLSHGEAVSVGMTCAARLAVSRGMIPPDVLTRQTALLERFRLPIELPAAVEAPPDAVLAAMRSDKKNVAGALRLVLPVRLGEVRVFADVPEEQVTAALTP